MKKEYKNAYESWVGMTLWTRLKLFLKFYRFQQKNWPVHEFLWPPCLRSRKPSLEDRVDEFIKQGGMKNL